MAFLMQPEAKQLTTVVQRLRSLARELPRLLAFAEQMQPGDTFSKGEDAEKIEMFRRAAAIAGVHGAVRWIPDEETGRNVKRMFPQGLPC